VDATLRPPGHKSVDRLAVSTETVRSTTTNGTPPGTALSAFTSVKTFVSRLRDYVNLIVQTTVSSSGKYKR
jgi:hypothetical protein